VQTSVREEGYYEPGSLIIENRDSKDLFEDLGAGLAKQASWK
jgi:hypothetical protein